MHSIYLHAYIVEFHNMSCAQIQLSKCWEGPMTAQALLTDDSITEMERRSSINKSMKNWPLLWHRSTSMGLCFFFKNQWHFRFFFPTNNREIKPNTDTANTSCFLPFTMYSDKRFSHSSLWLICLYVLHFPRPQLLLAVACLTVWFLSDWLALFLPDTDSDMIDCQEGVLLWKAHMNTIWGLNMETDNDGELSCRVRFISIHTRAG